TIYLLNVETFKVRDAQAEQLAAKVTPTLDAIRDRVAATAATLAKYGPKLADHREKILKALAAPAPIELFTVVQEIESLLTDESAAEKESGKFSDLWAEAGLNDPKADLTRLMQSMRERSPLYRLYRYVQNGGNVVFFTGDRIDATYYNDVLYRE